MAIGIGIWNLTFFGDIVLFRFAAWRYIGLTVGLDNISPWDSAPNWLQHALCGRYLDATITVPVNLTIPCTDVGNANRYRFVIIQSAYGIPASLCFREIQVFVNGKQELLFDH